MVNDLLFGPQDRHCIRVKSPKVCLAGLGEGISQGETRDQKKASGNLEKGLTWSRGVFLPGDLTEKMTIM